MDGLAHMIDVILLALALANDPSAMKSVPVLKYMSVVIPDRGSGCAYFITETERGIEVFTTGPEHCVMRVFVR